jgi:hypothetical protein
MKEKFPKKLDPLDKRLSDAGFKGGASKQKLSYTERKKLGKDLAKKFDNTKSKKEKQNILKEVKDKGVREMFNTFKKPTGKSLGQTGYTSAGRKPTMSQQESGKIIRRDYAKGGLIKKSRGGMINGNDLVASYYEKG